MSSGHIFETAYGMAPKIPKGTLMIVDRHVREQTAKNVTVQPYQRLHVPRGPNKKPSPAAVKRQRQADLAAARRAAAVNGNARPIG